MADKEMNAYKVLLEGSVSEIVEKKSRFITTIRKVESEEEALAFIDEMKKKYWNASHNCSAFVIGKNAELTRCSDDGEPGGTAGRPMLEVLLGEGIRNIAAVVTRYFGGTLLGTGGLVRAYSQAVKEGIKICRTGIMRYGYEVTIETDYNGIGKILYLLGQRQIEPLSGSYTDKVELLIRLPAEMAEILQRDMMEVTGGKVIFMKTQELYFIDK